MSINNQGKTAAAELQVKVRRLSDKIGTVFPEPHYATPGSAGIDLVACLEEPLVLQPGEIAKVATGIAIEIPNPAIVGLVFARSGLAYKQGLNLVNGVGVIDSDYRGEVGCLMQNNGGAAYTIQPGDRIAQLAFLPVLQAELVFASELNETMRGAGGFGSTGK